MYKTMSHIYQVEIEGTYNCVEIDECYVVEASTIATAIRRAIGNTRLEQVKVTAQLLHKNTTLEEYEELSKEFEATPE